MFERNKGTIKNLESIKHDNSENSQDDWERKKEKVLESTTSK
jgi:hypothetical protein